MVERRVINSKSIIKIQYLHTKISFGVKSKTLESLDR